MKICVFGAASTKIDKEYIEAVEKLGEEMAKRGHSLVFGAGAGGVMGAAARGVTRKKGEIIGVIPHFFREESIESIYGNCTELIYTDTMAQRKSKMEDLADAFIIAPGGIGTFEEFFEVFTLKQLGRHTKPIVVFDVKDYYKELIEFLDKATEEKFLKEECKTLYDYTTDIEEAMSFIENDKRIKKDVHDLKIG